MQSRGDEYLSAQVSPHLHGTHLDDVVLHHGHKFAARYGEQAIAGDQYAQGSGPCSASAPRRTFQDASDAACL